MYVILIGLFLLLPCVDSFKSVDLRTFSYDIPPQEVSKQFYNTRTPTWSVRQFVCPSECIPVILHVHQGSCRLFEGLFQFACTSAFVSLYVRHFVFIPYTRNPSVCMSVSVYVRQFCTSVICFYLYCPPVLWFIIVQLSGWQRLSLFGNLLDF